MMKLCLLGLCMAATLVSVYSAAPAAMKITPQRATRLCILENKVTYAVASAYGKGDLKDDSEKSKCFLKCFAYKLDLFDKTTGDPLKEKLLEYTKYLTQADLPYGNFIDKCVAETERGDDSCDYVYRCYKCLWDLIKSQPLPESVRFSFYDVLGFNQAFDEGEIIHEEAKAAIEELKITPENADSF